MMVMTGRGSEITKSMSQMFQFLDNVKFQTCIRSIHRAQVGFRIYTLKR